MPAGQKKAADLITDGCEPPCGCWELNSGPLEEVSMFLTAEPSLQPLKLNFHSKFKLLTSEMTEKFSFSETNIKLLRVQKRLHPKHVRQEKAAVGW